ncbi:hypothetical protein [uncultured Algibacter sp.]|uniref:hypothetical protein n=1 Tax=uncultured Algibacter sp. TaxID=298659 RepID=UPI003217378A
MAKNIILLFFLFTIHQTVYSQEKDTLCYTINWSKTTKAFATYFRPLPLIKKDSLFLIKDYFIDGQLQMQGLSSSNTKDIFEGLVTWYYKNGNKKTERHYKKGKQDGRIKGFFEDGTLKSDGQVKNNVFTSGTFIYTCNCPFKVTKYKNQSITERLSYYKDTKTVAERQLIEYFDQVKKSIYYDRKGNEIASVNYKNRSGNYLEVESGTKIHFSYTNDFFVKAIIARTIISSEKNTKKEITLNSKNEQIAEGILEDGYPHEGKFLKKGAIISYKNGEKHGKITCCLDNVNISIEGEYKNRLEHNGAFFNVNKKTITSYQNGLLHGEKKVYDNNYNIVGLENYNRGVFNGKRITQNRFNKKLHTSFYNNDSVENGELFEGGDLTIYKNGKLIERTTYDYKTKAPKEITRYNELENITKKTFFKDGKTYTLLYKNGSPFEGVQVQPFAINTYKNGVYEGPFIIYDSKQTIIGNHKNFEHDGNILFIDTKTQDTVQCFYKAGKPITGIDGFRGRIGYKNGKKHGHSAVTVNNNSYVFDSISTRYNNGVKIDTVAYFKKKKLVAYGVYKNRKPFDGQFHDRLKLQNFKIYKNGILTKKEINETYKKYKHQFFYTNGQLEKEKVYHVDYEIDSLKYELQYKNNKPYSGRAFVKDSLSDIYVVTDYSKGKKNGSETYYKKTFENFFKKLIYKGDKLNGKAIFKYNLKTEDSIKGAYKNNKPINGRFINEYKTYLELDTYKKGVISSKAYYKNDAYYNRHDFIDSLVYKNNTPYSGLLLNQLEKRILIAKNYKNGTHTKTDISPSLSPYRSYKSVLHTPLKDSLISKNRFKYAINYKDSKKKSGTVTYYFNDETCGRLQFENDKITTVSIKNYDELKKEDYNFKLYFDDKNTLINEIVVDNFKARREVPINIIGEKYMALGSLERLQFQYPKALFTFILDEKVIGTLETRNNKPFEGIMFKPNSYDDTYSFRTYKNGKSIHVFNTLTKAELLQKLNIK